MAKGSDGDQRGGGRVLNLGRGPRRTLTLTSLAILTLISGAIIVACGDDSIGDQPSPGSPPGPPPQRREFPLTTPSLGGYALVDAFPGIPANIPSALVWTKVAEPTA